MRISISCRGARTLAAQVRNRPRRFARRALDDVSLPGSLLANGIELEALRAEIAARMASGTPKPAEAVFARLESKYRAADKSKHR